MKKIMRWGGWEGQDSRSWSSCGQALNFKRQASHFEAVSRIDGITGGCHNSAACIDFPECPAIDRLWGGVRVTLLGWVLI